MGATIVACQIVMQWFLLQMQWLLVQMQWFLLQMHWFLLQMHCKSMTDMFPRYDRFVLLLFFKIESLTKKLSFATMQWLLLLIFFM